MSAFWQGVGEGAATASKEMLDLHLETRRKRLGDRMAGILQDATAKRGIHTKDKREAEKALKAMYGLTGNWNDAALAIQKLGGVSKDGLNITTFIQDYHNALKTDSTLTVQDVLKYTGEQDGNMTSTQATNNMVTPFSYELPPSIPKQQDKGFLSSFGFGILGKDDNQQIREELTARGFDITRAGAKSAAQAMVNRAGGDVRNVNINWGALGQKQQQESLQREQALDFQKVKISAAKTSWNIAKKNFTFLDQQQEDAHDKVVADLASTRVGTQVKQQALETARTWDTKKARAAYEASVASTIASKSSDDFGKQYNLLTSEETHFQTELRRIETNQGANSNDYSIMARRLTDIRLVKSKISLAGLAAGDKDKMWSRISPITAANAIKADAYAAVGLKFALGINGRIEMLEEGSAGKVYEAAKNAYNNFQSTYGQYTYAPMQAQAKAMKMNMENAKASYVSEPINKHLNEIKNWRRDKDDPAVSKLSKARAPKIIRAFKTIIDNGVPKLTKDWDTLRQLPKGTVVHINSDQRLKFNFQQGKGTGALGIWDGRNILQKSQQVGEEAPSWTDEMENKLKEIESAISQ